jgi:hypothetical protein
VRDLPGTNNFSQDFLWNFCGGLSGAPRAGRFPSSIHRDFGDGIMSAIDFRPDV